VAFSIISLLGPVLGQSLNLYTKLAEAGIFASRGATLNWSDGILEQEWHIQVPLFKTKIGAIKDFFDRFQVKDIEIANCRDITGYIYPQGKDSLEKLVIISRRENVGIIHVRKILSEVGSDIAVIKFKSTIPREIINSIVFKQITSTPMFPDKWNVMEFSFSLVLDRADLWLRTFQSFGIRDIRHGFNIEIPHNVFDDIVPTHIERRINRSASAALSGNRDALEYHKVMRDHMLRYQEPEIASRLFTMIKFETAALVQVHNIIPTLQTYDLVIPNFSMILPTKLRVETSFNIEGNDFGIHGKIFLDFEKYKDLFSELLNEIENTLPQILRFYASYLLYALHDLIAKATNNLVQVRI